MLRNYLLGMPIYLYIILLLAVGLIIAGFIVPPMGKIDGSVLQGVGEIILGAWLLYVTANIPTILHEGAKIRAQLGKASIEIGKKSKPSDENETKGSDK